MFQSIEMSRFCIIFDFMISRKNGHYLVSILILAMVPFFWNHQNRLDSRRFQSGFQSGPETAPLAAVCARYCQSVSHFTAKSDTQLNISKKSLLLNVFPFCLKTLYIQ